MKPTSGQHELEIYGDEACTVRPSGTPEIIYVKLNRYFGFGSQTMWGTWADFPNFAFIFTPTKDAPNESYMIRVWGNFIVSYPRGSLRPGVYMLSNPLVNINVDGLQVSWGKIVN